MGVGMSGGLRCPISHLEKSRVGGQYDHGLGRGWSLFDIMLVLSTLNGRLSLSVVG